MAKEKETEELLATEEKASKTDKKAEKLEKKKEKAAAKKKELAEQIDEIKSQIADESDEKKKARLRKKRDELVSQRDGITKSKDGMTIPMAANTKKTIRAVVAVVVVIALLCTYVATGAVRYGLISHFGGPQSAFTGLTLTDADGEKHGIKVSTYNYYFAMTYNNLKSTQSQYEQYGIDLAQAGLDVDFDEKLSKQKTTDDDDKEITWAEHIQDEVVDSIKSTYTYYYEAVKANDGKDPEITEDQQKELDEALDDYKEAAEGYGYTLSGYLTAAMGKGVNEKVFRREATISYIAENYQEDYKEGLLSKEYTDEEYNDYKKENEDDLISVSMKFFECDSEDDAKAFAKALNSDGSNFAALASKYSEKDWDKEAYKNDAESTYNNITKPTLKNLGWAIATADAHTHEEGEEHSEDEEQKYSGLDKLFNAKKGDIVQYSTSVAYVTKAASLSNVNTVNVRHILVTPYFDAEEEDSSSAEATEATDEEWKAAYKQAKKILKEWKDGDATAESFAALAKEYSEDSNADDGGIYENVTPNQMVPTFNAWCFDSSRKTGDTAIVKTEYGYHIMYFESKGDLKAWQYTAQQALASEDGTDTTEKLEESYSIKINWFGSRYFEKDTDIDS
ncbi:MAG: peptidylprolyl isomerase [Eubacterium sp.]